MTYTLRTIPYEALDLLGEVDRLSYIEGLLTADSLDPEMLLYTGIEGRDVQATGALPLRQQTFGHTYHEYLKYAAETDKYGTAWSDTPLQYALNPDIEVPALITYDLDTLVESERTHEVWKSKTGNLSDAARMVIIIAT